VKPGDLVKCLDNIGVLVRVISPGDYTDERRWCVLWRGSEKLDSINERMLEAVSERC